MRAGIVHAADPCVMECDEGLDACHACLAAATSTEDGARALRTWITRELPEYCAARGDLQRQGRVWPAFFPWLAGGSPGQLWFGKVRGEG